MSSIPADISEDIVIIGFGGTAPTPVLELVSNAVVSSTNNDNSYQSIKPIRSQSMEYELLKAPYRTFLNNNSNTKSSSSGNQLIIYNLPTSLTEYVSTTIQNEVSYIKSILYSSLQSTTNNNNSKKKKILITYDSSTNQFLGIPSSLYKPTQILNEVQNCGLSNSSTKLTLQQLAKFDTQAASLSSKDVVILIGSGGREHALSVSLANSPLVKLVICVPGNGGMICEGGKIVNATIGMLNDTSDSEPLTKSDNETIVQLVKSANANMVVVGPEQPLVDGVVDCLAKECSEVRVFGPSMAAAELEASKVSLFDCYVFCLFVGFIKGLYYLHKSPIAIAQTINPHQLFRHLPKIFYNSITYQLQSIVTSRMSMRQ